MTRVSLIIEILLILGTVGEPHLDITRKGREFTVECWIEVERPAEQVWPLVWEFEHISGYVHNCSSIDSLDGGDGWYNVKYTADFPFLHTEITNHKWIIKKESSIGTRSIKSLVQSPFPLAFLKAEGYWKLYPLAGNRCKVYFKNTLEVDAAGVEVFYTGIARRDGKRILKNFKEYAESR